MFVRSPKTKDLCENGKMFFYLRDYKVSMKARSGLLTISSVRVGSLRLSPHLRAAGGMVVYGLLS